MRTRQVFAVQQRHGECHPCLKVVIHRPPHPQASEREWRARLAQQTQSQLRAEGAWPRRLWHVDEEAPLGKVVKVWGRSYKTECKRPPRCNLFVDVAWCDGSETAAVSFLYLMARRRS